MIQPGDFSGFRVKPGEIMAFVGVAVIASQTQVLDIIRTAVFYRDDVVNMKRHGLTDGSQTAVLTTASSTITDDLLLRP
jgi:hypothetical protein